MPHRRLDRNAHGELDDGSHCEYIPVSPHGEASWRGNEAYERDETVSV